MAAMIEAGTVIRDDAGNLIAVAKRDLQRGEHIYPDQFEWHGQAPLLGERIHPAILRALGRT